MQALYQLALEPVAEMTADPNSDGCRQGRLGADAIAAAFKARSKPNSATGILEGDITGGYDNLSQGWMAQHIPMEKDVLRKWLIDKYVYEQLWRRLRRRPPNQSRKWLCRKYWTDQEGRTTFSSGVKTKQGPRRYQVVRLSSIGIRRHRKIRATANPYSQEDAPYFWQRRHDQEKRFLPRLTSRESRVLLATGGTTAGPSHRGGLRECLSRMTGNCHGRF